MLNSNLLRLIVVVLIVFLPSACSEDVDTIILASPSKVFEVEGQELNDHVGPFSPLPEKVDVSNPKISLGKALFHDKRLSADDSISCASCHNIKEGGDDNLKTAIGINNERGPINTLTVINAAFNFVQFWDGRAASLEEQVTFPIHNPIEMGSNWTQVIIKLRADHELKRLFLQIYPDGITATNIADAIATYERALVTGDSKFDQYLRGNTAVFSEQEKQGYQLFISLGCSSCHQGRNVGGNMYQRFGIMGSYFEDRGNGLTTADMGRYNVTLREQDKFVFRVPSLRNVEKTAPYFHDGSIESLQSAIAVMAKYQLGRKISDNQVSDIAAFLRTLSGNVDESLK